AALCLAAILFVGCTASSPSSDPQGSKSDANSNKPALPISVKFKPADNGAGLAAEYTNNSDEYLEVWLSLSNPTDTSNDRTIPFNIGPRKTVVRQQQEGIGFAYKSGDVIVINHAKYAPLKITVP